jgi:predicted ATPase
MLKEFRVSNFKSLLNVEFRPEGLNLLVGTNNSGKTNLCHALRFMGLTSFMPLNVAAYMCTPEPWNLLNVYTSDSILDIEMRAQLKLSGKGREESLDFFYKLSISGNKSNSSKLPTGPFSVISECLNVSGERFNNIVLLENKEGHVRLLHEKRFLEQAIQVIPVPAYVETTAPPEASMLSRLFDLETNQRANLFKRYLMSWAYYNFDGATLRSNTARPMDRVLSYDGSNLCSVLYTFHNERPRDERKLVEAVRVLEPRLDLISFQSPDPEHVYMFFEDKQGHRFGVQNVSDGTLRFLAIAYLIISNRRQNIDYDPAPLIIIEEPENGIYVGHLKTLFEKIDPSGEEGQFIFTSHNPYFIDLFDAVPEGIHVVKMLGTYTAVTKPDVARVQEGLGKFSLGEMHFRGLLE